MTQVQRVKRHEWLPVVRRLRCNPSVKLTALIAATYGNADGGSIFPGVVRLANVTGLDDTTIKLGLKKLRTLGLMVRVFEGSTVGRRGGMADEHVLTLPVDIAGLPLLPADESDPDREKTRAERRAADAERKRRAKNRLSETRNRLSESSEQVVSDTGNRLSETTPPVHGPDHVLVDEGHHSARIERDRPGGRPREETYGEYEQRHRQVMVRPGEELSDEDELFVSGVIADDYVTARAGELDEFEQRTADGMRENGAHPKAIVNTIMKDRGYGEADYRAAQSYLLELDDETRKTYMDLAEQHWSTHFPDEPYRFVLVYAARLAQRRYAS